MRSTSWASSLVIAAVLSATAACSDSNITSPAVPAANLSVATTTTAGFLVYAPADSMLVGQTLQMTAGWTSKTITTPWVDTNAVWTSSDISIATVAKGLVTSLKAGAVTISAKSGNAVSSMTISVRASTTTTTTTSSNYFIAAPGDSLDIAQTMLLKATWIAKNVATPWVDTSAVWTTSNSGVATVVKGLVTGKAAGSVTISAKSGNLTASKILVVRAATTTTTPPPTTTVPTGSYKTVIADDFTSYSGTAALMANVGVGKLYNDGVNQSYASIDPTVTFNGHQTMKYNQPGGVSTTPELWPSLPTQMSNVWLHAVIRFSPGWTTKGILTNGTDNSYKILAMGWSAYDARAGFQFDNTSAYHIFTNAVTRTGQTAMPAVYGMAGSATTEWQDGAWYDYYLNYEVLTPTTTRYRLFKSRWGQTPVLVATVNNTVNSGYAAPLVGSVMLGQNFNQVRAATQNQAIWYGKWEVVDGKAYVNPFGIPGA
jgi:hypothetical protein